VTVNYDTANGTTSAANDCQASYYGYVGAHGTLTFQPGLTSQSHRFQ
jgi:hypothetical protein